MDIGAEKEAVALERPAGTVTPAAVPKARLDEIFYEDPAVFLIFSLVYLEAANRISELLELFPKDAELEQYVQSILVRFENAGVIEIRGDRIILKHAEPIFENSDPNVPRKFMPAIFRTVIERVLKNEAERPNVRKARREMARWFVFPDHPDLAQEAQEIALEYKAKMVALMERSKAMDAKSSQLRFAGIVNSVLEPEDFL